MGILYMKNQEIIHKLNLVNEEIAFLEEISQPTAEVEEKLESLRTVRHELEKGIYYDKDATTQNDQADRKEG